MFNTSIDSFRMASECFITLTFGPQVFNIAIISLAHRRQEKNNYQSAQLTSWLIFHPLNNGVGMKLLQLLNNVLSASVSVSNSVKLGVHYIFFS